MARITRTTEKVVDPEIHTEVVEDHTVSVDSPHAEVKHTRVIHEPLIKTEHPQEVFEVKKTILRFYQGIWYLLGVIEVLLAFRLALKAIAADPFSGFATLVYALSNPLAVPFSGVVKPSINLESGSVIEWSTVLAMVVYFIVAWGIVALIHMTKPVTPEEVDKSV